MKYLLLGLVLLVASCSLFEPQTPPIPDDSVSSDPLNLKGMFIHPSDTFDFTLYSELVTPSGSFFTDDNKSSFQSSSDFLKRLEFIKNSPRYATIKVEWSGSSSGVLSKNGEENDLPQRTCKIYLDTDTLEERCYCRVRYDASTDKWQLTYWEVVEKNGTYSFFNSEYSD